MEEIETFYTGICSSICLLLRKDEQVRFSVLYSLTIQYTIEFSVK